MRRRATKAARRRPLDVADVFRRGGKGLIDLLEFCVRSVRTDAVFLFLVGEYRTIPTAAKAVALYDLFCAPHAPARVSASDALPPFNQYVALAVTKLREGLELAASTAWAPPAERVPAPLPAKYLFDDIARRIEQQPRNQLAQVAERFDPALTPLENLPGGRMNEAQRFFVERVWQPNVRPRLVAAGFRRVGNVA